MMLNSSTVTAGSSTVMVFRLGSCALGLKFHCCRTISRNDCPPSGDQRKTYFCVRSVRGSTKFSQIRRSRCRWAKSEGQSIVLVEQNIKLALDLADDVVILNPGRVAFTGGVAKMGGNGELITSTSACSSRLP